MDAIRELGTGTIDDVIPILAREGFSFTRRQVTQALANARWDKKVEVVERLPGKGRAHGLNVYAPAEVVRRPPRPANSVFDLAASMERACL